MAVDPASIEVAAKGDWLMTLLGGVAAAVISAGGWLYKSVVKRITILEHTAMMKDDFLRYEDRAERARTDLQTGINALHTKVDVSMHRLDERIGELVRVIIDGNKK